MTEIVVERQCEVFLLCMQHGQIKLVPTGLQIREVDGLSPIEQDSILTSVWILWQHWLSKFDSQICCCLQANVERYAWDLSNGRSADHLGHLRNSRNGQALVQTYYHWAGWRELHIYINRLSRWVDNSQGYITLQRLQCIQVNLVPFIYVCLEVNALVDVQQLCSVAWVIGIIDHIYAEANCLICSKFHIYLSYLIVDHLIQYVEHLLWYYHSVVQTTRNHEDGLSSNIILATYGRTHGHGGQALCLGGEVELRQLACVLEQ